MKLRDDGINEREREIAECAYCQREIAKGNNFYPPHFASAFCQSGKRNHCSCDTCF